MWVAQCACIGTSNRFLERARYETNDSLFILVIVTSFTYKLPYGLSESIFKARYQFVYCVSPLQIKGFRYVLMLIFSNVLYSCSLNAAFNMFLRYNKDSNANENIKRKSTWKYKIIYKFYL